MNEKLYYEINGNMGTTLKVYDTYCIISMTNGGKAFFFGGLQGAMKGEKNSFIVILHVYNLKIWE